MATVIPMPALAPPERPALALLAGVEVAVALVDVEVPVEVDVASASVVVSWKELEIEELGVEDGESVVESALDVSEEVVGVLELLEVVADVNLTVEEDLAVVDEALLLLVDFTDDVDERVLDVVVVAAAAGLKKPPIALAALLAMLSKTFSRTSRLTCTSDMTGIV